MLNNNFQYILIKFGLWFGLLFITMIIGISNVFAYTYEDIGYFNNNSQVLVEVAYNNQPLTLSINNEYYIDDVYSLDIFVSNINLSQDYVYWFEIYLPQTNSINADIASVVWYGDNNTTGSCTILTTYFSNNYPHVTFKCGGSTNIRQLYIRYYNSSNNYIITSNYFTWNYTYMRRRVPESTDNTGEIKDALNQQTQDIINNNNSNTQDIINNQNQNIQQQIESQKVCTYYDKSSIIIDKRNLSSNGSVVNNNNYGITDYIPLNSNSELTAFIGSGFTGHMCFYNINKVLISCLSYADITSSSTGTLLTIPANASYFRAPINYNYNRPTFNLCRNGNQALNDSIDSLNKSLTDDSSVNIDSLGDTAGWLPAGPIDSIINLPLNLFNNLLTALNGTCQPINIPLPYVDSNLPIPCISTIFNQIDGLPNFWNWVGIISSIVILYRYLLNLYKYYDDLTTLKANFISDFGGAP